MQNTQMGLPNHTSLTAGNDSLAALVSSLGQIVSGSEEDFLALGMNLQKVQMMSSAQRQKIAATMGLFKADGDKGILAQITSYVQRSQCETDTAQQTAASLCADLAGMIRLMDAIEQRTQALERAGLFLHVIGINTGIECARYGQMEAMFKVVSQDTILLAAQIRQATEKLLEQTAKAKTEQGKTLQGARHSIESLQKLARQSKQTTDSALGKVAELIEYSISMVNEVEKMSVNITGEINRVVMGIQFHDNLRQRIEHVNDALLETEGLAFDAAEEDHCNAYLSVVLQKAQLDQLVGELEALYHTQAGALANIVESASSLETRLGKVASEQSKSQSSDNPVVVLLAGISALQHLNEESMTLGREIVASSERAEQIANEMHAAIENTFIIANHVKINALNAIIKAAKFGRIGESLQVLAQGMVEVSKDTRQMVTIFNGQIEELNQLVKNETTARAAQSDKAGADEFDAQQVEQVFHRFRDELVSSKHDCQNLTQSLAREQQHLVFIARLKDALAQHAEQLGHYAETIRPENEELLERLRQSFGKQLAERYTMNEEREIHNQLHLVKKSSSQPAQSGSQGLGQDSAAAASVELFSDPPTAAAPAEEEPELWGMPQSAPTGDVELFSDPQPAIAASPHAEPELWGMPQSAPTGDIELFDSPAAGSDNVELWDESVAPAPVIDLDDAKEKKDDFGDNVELF